MGFAQVLSLLLAFSVPESGERTALQVETADGVMLETVVYDWPDRRAPMVVLTGHGHDGVGSRAVEKLGEQLYRRGYAVVTWSRRGTGRSGGLYDLGGSDADDLAAVGASLMERYGRRSLGLVGIGSGARATLRAAAGLARAHGEGEIDAVAVYGAGIPPAGTHEPSEPPGLLRKLWMRAQGVRVEADSLPPGIDRLREPLQRLRGTPLLVMAPGRESFASVDDVRRLFDAAEAPKEWLFAPSAGADPSVLGVAGRLQAFLERNLRREP